MVRSRWGVSKSQKLPGRHRGRHLLLKRTYALARCTWRALDHFKTYVWSSVVAYNLALFARLRRRLATGMPVSPALPYSTAAC